MIRVQFRHMPQVNGKFTIGYIASTLDEARANPNRFRTYLGDSCEKGHPAFDQYGKQLKGCMRFVTTNMCAICRLEEVAEEAKKIVVRPKIVKDEDLARAEARRKLELRQLAKEYGIEPEDMHLI